MKNILIRISDPLHGKLVKVCSQREETKSCVIRRALELYVQTQEVNYFKGGEASPASRSGSTAN